LIRKHFRIPRRKECIPVENRVGACKEAQGLNTIAQFLPSSRKANIALWHGNSCSSDYSDKLQRIKRGALLINTARGGLIDPAALTRALDVLEGEELLKDERQILAQSLAQDKLRTLLLNHSLLNRDNVVITPHIAFNSREAVQRILETTLDNLRAFLRGQPRNLVNPG